MVSTASFVNTSSGFAALQHWLCKHCKYSLPVIYLAEATGIYLEQLCWFLFNQGCSVVVLPPNKAKQYKEALGLKSKNDKIDAAALSRLVCEQ